jgi:hypothetical protein
MQPKDPLERHTAPEDARNSPTNVVVRIPAYTSFGTGEQQVLRLRKCLAFARHFLRS